MWVARDSKKRSPVGRSVIGSDHRAGYDEKHEHQRRANMRARDNGVASPVMAAANDSLY